MRRARTSPKGMGLPRRNNDEEGHVLLATHTIAATQTIATTSKAGPSVPPVTIGTPAVSISRGATAASTTVDTQGSTGAPAQVDLSRPQSQPAPAAGSPTGTTGLPAREQARLPTSLRHARSQPQPPAHPWPARVSHDVRHFFSPVPTPHRRLTGSAISQKKWACRSGKQICGWIVAPSGPPRKLVSPTVDAAPSA